MLADLYDHCICLWSTKVFIQQIFADVCLLSLCQYVVHRVDSLISAVWYWPVRCNSPGPGMLL